MEGTWADTNGKHIYTGNQQVKLTDMQMTDVQRFLETHGFKHVESTSGSYSPADEGESTYRMQDGRHITLRQKMGSSGVLSLEGATGLDVSGGTKSPLDTIGDLKNFVELGRGTDSPTQGGINMDSEKSYGIRELTPEMVETAKREWVSKPMGPYANWAKCKEAGKSDAYCGYLYHHASPEGHNKEDEVNLEASKAALRYYRSLRKDVQPGQGELAPPWVGQGNVAGGEVKVDQIVTHPPEKVTPGTPTAGASVLGRRAAQVTAQPQAQSDGSPANAGMSSNAAHAVRFEMGASCPSTGKMEDHADAMCAQIHPTMTHPEYEAQEGEHAIQGQPAVMSAPQVTQHEAYASQNPSTVIQQAQAIPPQVMRDEAAAGNDPHSLMAQSVAGQPMAMAHQTLQRAGYTLLGTDGEIGGTLDHTYQSGEGHKITVSSKDGATVTGIKFDQPKPQVAQAPGYQGLYGAGAGQQGQQPQQRQDVPAYGGGAAQAPPMGMKSFYNPYTKTWMPKGSVWDPAKREWTVTKDLGAVIPTGLQPSAVMCDWHHGAIPFDNSEGRVTFVDFKGLRVCRKCWNELGPRGHFVHK